MFGGPFSGNFMSPDNTSDGWLRKKWVIQNQRRVLLKSGSGESQQEPLNEVLANMICDRLDIKNYVKYQCGYQEDQSPFITISRRDKLVTWLGERIRMLCESKMDNRKSLLDREDSKRIPEKKVR